MITFDDKNRVYQNRKGETKCIQIGKIIHNPNVNGSPDKRKPFLYGGSRMTADELRVVADKCDEIESNYKIK